MSSDNTATPNPKFRSLQKLHRPALEANSPELAATKLVEYVSAFLCSAVRQRRLPHASMALALALNRRTGSFLLIEDDGVWPKPSVLPLERIPSVLDPHPESKFFYHVADDGGPFVGGFAGRRNLVWDKISNPAAPDWRSLGWTRFRMEVTNADQALEWLRSDTFKFRVWSNLIGLLLSGEYPNLPNDLSYLGLLAFLQEASDEVVKKLGGKDALQEIVTAKAKERISATRSGGRN